MRAEPEAGETVFNAGGGTRLGGPPPPNLGGGIAPGRADNTGMGTLGVGRCRKVPPAG